MAQKAKEALDVDELDVVADRGYYSSEQILECSEIDVTVTLPKPETTGMKAKGQFGKPDFRYVAEHDMYICPAGQALSFLSHKRQTGGPDLRRYATKGCETCPLKTRCTTSTQRVVTRWEHEHLVEDVQHRLDENPQAMRTRRETVEHPFGTIKMRMGATHFLMKRLKNVKTEMALSVLAYNLTRVMNIIGIRPLMAAIRA
jgi:transposase